MTTALYYAPDACSLASHIVLREIGDPFELRKVSVMTGANLLPEYLAINPKGRVPALFTGGFILTENAAILAYLARKYPSANLIGSPGSEAEARCLEMLAWLSSTVHVAFSQLVRPGRYVASEQAYPSVQESGRANYGRYLAEIDTHLGRNRFAAGKDFSVADPYLLVFFRWGLRHGYDMTHLFPSYHRFVDDLYQRESVGLALEAEGLTRWPGQAPPPS